jgi:multidrug resistance efflux pump
MLGKWVLLSVAAVLAGVGGGALSLHFRRPAAPQPVPAAGAAVIANREITLQGSIRPQHITGVSAPVNGLVETLLADVGQEVYQGQVLARVGAQGLESAREMAANNLDRAQEQVGKAEAAVTSARLEQSRADADFERAQTARDRTQKAYSRQQTLVTQGATPRLTFEKAESEYQNAVKEYEVMDAAVRAAREQAQSALADVTAKKKIVEDRAQQLEEAQTSLLAAEVHSPVDGTVVGRKAETGKPAMEAGDEFFQIATDLYALEVIVEPKPEDLKRIHPGQPALVLVLDLESQGMPGAVSEVKANQVIVQFNSNTPAIKPGMRADVRLKLD